jgi:hypothetical protein
MSDDDLHSRWSIHVPQWPLRLEPEWLRCAASYLAGLRWHQPEDYDLRLLSLELQRRLYG